ncbi:putative C6 transcription factor RosA-like [Aspergillus clavatus NRRL 1]|uniref:C6 transcription factor, putative n=1 Tax=Aspergillus clavatus (strain ATCC 1007 / CBS 513.65 / DSM 816 / NCTC 3887 / NRRL 1 / QM 1276 / 107) TaxID=344612 RepID=A1CNL7_ASPCL|nr:C6 transcription factor, putative [Aspergillus clavatus NRRL 1]EAW07238.1 C6 transcription factor, putative [Aspergillus clavatus NRRL 1]
MAGPGGGPPRKSHTKSRNGCATCKRRHIRCDETFPQCRNCTKHNCRCDYMDVAIAREQSSKARKTPDLLMSPEIETEIENWHVTGVPPFPELMHYPRNTWYKLFRSDLRLVHHIIGLSIDLHRRGFGECTIWAQKMPLFLSLALSNDFVMSSILTLSASHLAWITRNQETKQLAYHHRGIAIKGLHKAIGSFSKENCEAILAASILLSWQASDWQTWASLQQGLTTVLNAMHPIWKHQSELAVLLENQRYLGCTNSPMMTGYQFQDADLASLDQIIVALQSVRKRVVHNHEYYTRVGELLEFVRNFQRDLLSQTPQQAFDRVQPLREWLFWLPPAMLRGGDADIGALAILAQFYGVGVALDSLFPDMGGAYLGPVSVDSVEEIYRIIVTRSSADPFSPELQLAMSLMDLPRHLVARYKSRLQWSRRQSFDHCSPTPPSPYNNNYHEYRLASSSSPSSSSATYAPYTPPLQSPLHSPTTVTIASSPFDTAGTYVTAPGSHILYPPSPRLLSEPTSLQHSPAFAPPYLANMLCGDIPRADGTLDLSLGLYGDTQSMHVATLTVTTEPWTGTICT